MATNLGTSPQSFSFERLTLRLDVYFGAGPGKSVYPREREGSIQMVKGKHGQATKCELA